MDDKLIFTREAAKLEERNNIPPRSENKNKSRTSIKKTIRKIFIATTILFALVLATVSLYLIITMPGWEELDLNKLENIHQSSFIYDYKDEKITSIHGTEDRIKISLSDIPEHVQNAFIAVEDIRFREHPGFDVRRMIGALIADIKAGGFVEGASTITQQVIRNSHLTQEKKISRKIQEIYLAYQLEKKYSKDQILEAYLNLIYFGKGTYGIEAASRKYFGKSAKELTVAEGALLAGIPKNPSRYSPFEDKNASLKRRNLILDLMIKYEMITPEQGNKFKEEPLNLAQDKSETYPHRFFMDMVLKEAADILNVNEDELFTNGYRIFTTLDSDLQKFAEEVYSNADLFPKSPVSSEVCQSALVVLDSSTGEVRAILGGREEKRETDSPIRKGFNRAIQSKRQPGSAIKPIVVYAPAIENFGYTPVTFIEDSPITIGNYTPSNYGGKFRGWVTLREAVAYSINIPAVKILYDIGLKNGISFAQKLGIPFAQEDYNNLSVALGGFHYGISPMDLAEAYTAFADRGMYKEYTTIRRIEDSHGVPLYKFEPKKQQLVSEETAFIISNILQSTVQWSGGTASRLRSLQIPLCAKTGTVQLPDTEEFRGISGAKDAWIAAYNPDYVIVVWMGFDETNSKNYLPPGTVGGSYPADIAKQIVSYLYQNRTPSNFIKPLNVVEVELDLKTLNEYRKVVLASPLTPEEYIIREFFTPNTVPKEETDYWVVPQTPQDFRIRLSQEGYPTISFTPANDFAVYEIYRSGAEEDEPILLYRANPTTNNTVEWRDSFVKAGETYNYFITPVHPDIIIEGKPLKGVSTRVLTVKIPGMSPPSRPDDNPDYNNDFTEPSEEQDQDISDENSDIPTIELDIN